MGTRGAIGFRIKRQDKVTYNHSDSYPEYLGKKVVEYIQTQTIESLKKTAENIILVQEDSIPTAKQLEECKSWNNFSVGKGTDEDWYCVLRESQGDLSTYSNGLKYMIDNKSFLLDSLFCEYAYIINLDNNTLEFYFGYNKFPITKGRYSKQKQVVESAYDNGYYGVVLIEKFPLHEIMALETKQIEELIKNMDKKSSSHYQRQEKKLKKLNN